MNWKDNKVFMGGFEETKGKVEIRKLYCSPKKVHEITKKNRRYGKKYNYLTVDIVLIGDVS